MSYKHKSYTTTTHWKAPDSSSNMNWSDILLLKSTDCEVFQAPEYFHSNVLENHLHSYPALLHMATFTDPMNFFQEVPAEISRTPGSRTAQLFERTRTPMTWKLMKLSVWISLPLTLLCLWGIFFHLPDIFRTRNWLGFWLACALAYHGMMVMNFPRLAQPYYWGYWLPRYILPSVLTYLVFGIRAIDQKAPRLQKWVLVYSLGLAALWVAFL